MELTLVGLQFSGKTTFVNVIAVSILIKEQSFDDISFVVFGCDFYDEGRKMII